MKNKESQSADFIIVGSGLAGITVAHTLQQFGLSFKIISKPELSSCSKIAAGIYNPVVFYRLTKSYLVDKVLAFAEEYYRQIEILLSQKLLFGNTIAKIFSGESEYNLWQQKAEEGVGYYLGTSSKEPYASELIKANEGLGLVKHSGNLDCNKYLEASTRFFRNNFIEEEFDFNELKIQPGKLVYKNIDAGKIIFCEGHLISQNPFFKEVKLKPVKGEILTIKIDKEFQAVSPDLIFVKKCYVLPLGEGIYKVGATYNWSDLSEATTVEGREILVGQLKDIIKVPFTIIDHEAGVRPASEDRRPIIGVHPEYSQLAVLNGLGTKGVMHAPYFANELILNLTQNKSLHKEINVARFY